VTDEAVVTVLLVVSNDQHHDGRHHM
jgi:hypothetical protein